jgi:hypothetical protein
MKPWVQTLVLKKKKSQHIGAGAPEEKPELGQWRL